jgi:hypothetical protein
MSIAQLSVTMKLDHAYEIGVIAFVSAKNILIPVRDRGDIQATEAGEIVVRFDRCWIPVRPEMIKFCHRH